MSMWETIFATVPATVVVISVMIALNRSTNTRIDGTNKQIGDLATRLDKRIDDTNKQVSDLAIRLDKRIDELNTRFDKRIDELNTRFDKRIDDLATRLDKRIDDLRELMILTFGKIFSKEDIDKTGTEG